MHKNNYPQGRLDDLEPALVQETITCLMDLRKNGKPRDNAELRQRIADFFTFCQQSSIRPGVETLSMACGIHRRTLYQWSKGIGCDNERMEIIQEARAVIDAFIEQALLSGRISPPSGIFLMKNWLGYKDTVSIEESTPLTEERRALSATELPKLGTVNDDSEHDIV